MSRRTDEAFEVLAVVMLLVWGLAELVWGWIRRLV